MITESGEIVINKPVAEVFSFVTDLENDLLWCPEVASIDRESGEKSSVGTAYSTVVGPKFMKQPGGYEITKSTPPSFFEWTFWQAKATGTGSYTLESTDSATSLRYDLTASFPGIQRLMGPGVRLYSQYIRIPRQLRKLKQYLESTTDPE